MSAIPTDALQHIGELRARADAVDERLESIETKLDDVRILLASTKGGLRAVLAIAGLAAAAGGGFVEIVHWAGKSIHP